MGAIDDDGQVLNLGVVDANVVGTARIIGILAGLNNGDVTNCYCTGTVIGSRWVGGLVGQNYEGTITTSYSTGSVSGGSRCVGGLVGRNNGGDIIDSYSTGMVSGDRDVGGLVGLNTGNVIRCYSIGVVDGTENIGSLVGANYYDGSISNCFWDVETSGLTNMCGHQSDDAKGCDDSFGKTTVEMQTTSTFLNAGWDFVDETENGTEDIWWIVEGQDYPRLWWELIPEN